MQCFVQFASAQTASAPRLNNLFFAKVTVLTFSGVLKGVKTIPLLFSLSLCACGPFVIGNGVKVTSARAVSAFQKVDVSGALIVVASVGANQVSVVADENIQPLIEAVVEGDTLKLRSKPGLGYQPTAPVRVVISNPVFEGVTASGASEVTAEATAVQQFAINASGASKVQLSSLSTTVLSIEASGASDVAVSGNASEAKVDASGSSSVRIQPVRLQTLSVEVSGASTLEAQVVGSASGVVSGASEVTLFGSPSVSIASSGDSRVTVSAK